MSLINKLKNIFNRGENTYTLGNQDLSFLVANHNYDFRQSPTAMACANIIGNSISTLPVSIRKYDKDKDNYTIDHNHYVNKFLNGYVNGYMSSKVFFKFICDSMTFEDGAYGVLLRNSRGRITDIVGIAPHLVGRQMKDGKIDYMVSLNNGKQLNVPNANMLHIPSLNGWDENNLTGYSAVNMFRKSIGLESEINSFSFDIFQNGINSNTVIEQTEPLTPENLAKLTSYLQKQYSGSNKSGTPILSPKGVEVKKISSGFDENIISTYDAVVGQIAMVFGVPSPLISNTVEQQSTGYNSSVEINRQFVNYRLRPMVENIENELNSKLFSETDRKAGFSIEFDFTNMLRGDNTSHAEYLTKMIGGSQNNGVITVNEARKSLGLSARDGGDELYKINFPEKKVNNNDE